MAVERLLVSKGSLDRYPTSLKEVFIQESLFEAFKSDLKANEALHKYFVILGTKGSNYCTSKDNVIDLGRDDSCKHFKSSIWYDNLYRHAVLGLDSDKYKFELAKGSVKISRELIQKHQIEQDVYTRISNRYKGIKDRVKGKKGSDKTYLDKGIQNRFGGFEYFLQWWCGEVERLGLTFKESLAYHIDRIDGNGHYEPSNCQLLLPVVNNIKWEVEVRHIMFGGKYVPCWAYEKRAFGVTAHKNKNYLGVSTRIHRFENNMNPQSKYYLENITPFLCGSRIAKSEFMPFLDKHKYLLHIDKDRSFFEKLLEEFKERGHYIYYDFHKDPINAKYANCPKCKESGRGNNKLYYSARDLTGEGKKWAVLHCDNPCCDFQFMLSLYPIDKNKGVRTNKAYFLPYNLEIEKALKKPSQIGTGLDIKEVLTPNERTSVEKKHKNWKQRKREEMGKEAWLVYQRGIQQRHLDKKRAEQGLPPRKIMPREEKSILELQSRKNIRDRLKRDKTLTPEIIAQAREKMKELAKLELERRKARMGEEAWKQSKKAENARRLKWYKENPDHPRTKRLRENKKRYELRQKAKKEAEAKAKETPAVDKPRKVIDPNEMIRQFLLKHPDRLVEFSDEVLIDGSAKGLL